MPSSSILYRKNLIFVNLHEIAKSVKFTALEKMAAYGIKEANWDLCEGIAIDACTRLQNSH